MAVYKKTYRPTTGELTPSWSRLLVIPRYAIADLRRSKFLTIFFIASFIYPLICALIIYVQHNTSALKLLNVQGARSLISINVTFFLSCSAGRACWRFSWRPSSVPARSRPISRITRLSLYLARPFSRVEYVIGKMSVLLLLMSLMTWVPGLLLFLLQGYLEGWDWMTKNVRLATGMFFGAWIWICCWRCSRWRFPHGSSGSPPPAA